MFVKINILFLELGLKLEVFLCADASLLKYCHCQDLVGIAPNIPGLILPSSYGGNIGRPCSTTPVHEQVLGCLSGAAFWSWTLLVLYVHQQLRVILPHHGITYGDTEYYPKAEGLSQLKTWLHKVMMLFKLEALLIFRMKNKLSL